MKDLEESQQPAIFVNAADHREYRQKADDGCGDGREDGAANFGRRAKHDVKPIFLGTGFVEMFQDVLTEDDPHVDHRANRDGDTR